MNTRLVYMYRDGANYKAQRTVFYSGVLTAEQRALIESTLESGENFIPHDVGLAELQEQLASFPDPEDDHVWHELVGLETVDKLHADVAVEGEVSALVEAFSKIGDPANWKIAEAVERLGL